MYCHFQCHLRNIEAVSCLRHPDFFDLISFRHVLYFLLNSADFSYISEFLQAKALEIQLPQRFPFSDYSQHCWIQSLQVLVLRSSQDLLQEQAVQTLLYHHPEWRQTRY